MLGLDGQSNPATTREVDNIWNDPNCERDAFWNKTRSEIKAGGRFPDAGLVLSDIDIHVQRCLFGVIALLVHACFKALNTTGKTEEAVKIFTILDAVYSTVHPGLLARSDWDIADSEIGRLRRDIAHNRRSYLPPGVKVFVYAVTDFPELALLTQGSSFCSRGQWGSEVHIHDFMLSISVDDPDSADIFFVPGYAICMFEGGFASLDQINDLYASVIPKLHYFARKEGRDHAFTFASGLGLNVFKTWHDWIPNSIILTPETGLFNDAKNQIHPDFVPWKDVVIPGHVHRTEILQLLEARTQHEDIAQRPILLSFFGRVDNQRGSHPATAWMGDDTPRHSIWEMIKTWGSDGSYSDIVLGSNATVQHMYSVMARSRFCLVPRGKSAWSLRLYEALWAGCIPVILSDRWVLPASTTVEEETFSLRFPMRDAKGKEIVSKLRAVPGTELQRLGRNSEQARCLLSYAFAPSFLQERYIPLGGICENHTSALQLLLQELRGE